MHHKICKSVKLWKVNCSKMRVHFSYLTISNFPLCLLVIKAFSFLGPQEQLSLHVCFPLCIFQPWSLSLCFPLLRWTIIIHLSSSTSFLFVSLHASFHPSICLWLCCSFDALLFLYIPSSSRHWPLLFQTIYYFVPVQFLVLFQLPWGKIFGFPPVRGKMLKGFLDNYFIGSTFF